MEINQVEQPKKRPVFLTVLCILTLVSTGFSVLGLIANLAMGPQSPDELEKSTAEGMVMVNQLNDTGSHFMADQIEKLIHSGSYTNDSFYLILSVNFLTVALGLGGAILMLRGRKLGFHSYILYSILSILSIYIAIPVSEVPTFIILFGIIFSGLFIFMYSRNLHWLK